MLTLDVVGAGVDLITTITYALELIWCWPLTLLSAVINGILYWQTGLYADMGLSSFYFFSAIYGWYAWSRGGVGREPLPVRHIRWRELGVLLLVGMGATGLLGLFLRSFSPSTVPFFDAGTTIFSLVAQWLICRKVLENWLVWFGVDCVYVGLYYYKHIPAHSILLIIYLVIACVGFARWAHSMNCQKNTLKLSIS